MFELLILVSALGTVGVSGASISKHKRNKVAKKKWEELNENRKIHTNPK